MPLIPTTCPALLPEVSPLHSCIAKCSPFLLSEALIPAATTGHAPTPRETRQFSIRSYMCSDRWCHPWLCVNSTGKWVWKKECRNRRTAAQGEKAMLQRKKGIFIMRAQLDLEMGGWLRKWAITQKPSKNFKQQVTADGLPWLRRTDSLPWQPCRSVSPHVIPHLDLYKPFTHQTI